jgi:hypothetical protein
VRRSKGFQEIIKVAVVVVPPQVVVASETDVTLVAEHGVQVMGRRCHEVDPRGQIVVFGAQNVNLIQEQLVYAGSIHVRPAQEFVAGYRSERDGPGDASMEGKAGHLGEQLQQTAISEVDPSAVAFEQRRHRQRFITIQQRQMTGLIAPIGRRRMRFFQAEKVLPFHHGAGRPRQSVPNRPVDGCHSRIGLKTHCHSTPKLHAAPRRRSSNPVTLILTRTNRNQKKQNSTTKTQKDTCATLGGGKPKPGKPNSNHENTKVRKHEM